MSLKSLDPKEKQSFKEKGLAEDQVINDASERNWVDRFAPKEIRPYLKLARLDRPIGIWLLFWPAGWAIAMADNYAAYPDPKLLFLFFMGAVVMRGAGCAYNDIIDRDYDVLVERTRKRPIAGQRITVRQGWLFAGSLALLGFAILVNFNLFAMGVGAASLILVALYPFMKRVTYWPQAFLGLTFNWGVLVGWAAVSGTLSLAALFLYIAGIFWTLGYDTIYAHQDKADDILAGVKSTALKFGENTKAWLFVFYGLSWGFLFLAGLEAEMDKLYYVGLAFAFFHFHAQIRLLDIHNPEVCLKIFKSNNLFGFGLFLAIWASKGF